MRSVVTFVGSTVTSALRTAFALVSPSKRSLTGIANVAMASPAVTRPTRWANFAANPASSELLVPPSARARASHSSNVDEDSCGRDVDLFVRAREWSGHSTPLRAGLPAGSAGPSGHAGIAGRRRVCRGRSGGRPGAAPRHRRRDPAAGQLIESSRPEAASASAVVRPTPSVRPWEMTRLRPVPPSVNGSTARCHGGPCLLVQRCVGLLGVATHRIRHGGLGPV